MNPSRVMGTFLRTWRAEWARMSRAQLATSIAALCKGRKRVTPFIIQEWEEGQPPKTTAELEALCQVMGRNGLIQPEMNDFRRTVFAACADRQYPEAFAAEVPSQRPDIAEWGWAMYDPGSEPREFPRVTLVAVVEDLRRATQEGSSSLSAPRHVRAQQEALCMLTPLLAHWHNHCARYAIAADMFRDCAEAMERFFGDDANLGGFPVLTPMAQRRCELSTRITAIEHTSRQEYPQRLERVDPRVRQFALKMLELAEEAEARRDSVAAAQLFMSATDPLHLGEPVYERFQERFDALMAEAHLWDDPAGAHQGMHARMLAEGRLDEAERHMREFERLRDGDSHERGRWRESWGNALAAEGDYTGASEAFGAGLQLAREAHNGWFQHVFAREVEACERADRAVSSRSISVPRTAPRGGKRSPTRPE